MSLTFTISSDLCSRQNRGVTLPRTLKVGSLKQSGWAHDLFLTSTILSDLCSRQNRGVTLPRTLKLGSLGQSHWSSPRAARQENECSLWLYRTPAVLQLVLFPHLEEEEPTRHFSKPSEHCLRYSMGRVNSDPELRVASDNRCAVHFFRLDAVEAPPTFVKIGTFVMLSRVSNISGGKHASDRFV